MYDESDISGEGYHSPGPQWLSRDEVDSWDSWAEVDSCYRPEPSSMYSLN